MKGVCFPAWEAACPPFWIRQWMYRHVHTTPAILNQICYTSARVKGSLAACTASSSGNMAKESGAPPSDESLFFMFI